MPSHLSLQTVPREPALLVKLMSQLQPAAGRKRPMRVGPHDALYPRYQYQTEPRQTTHLCNNQIMMGQVSSRTNRLVHIPISIYNQSTTVIIDTAACHNFVHQRFVCAENIRPQRKPIQLATHNNTGKSIGETTLTIKIRDISLQVETSGERHIRGTLASRIGCHYGDCARPDTLWVHREDSRRSKVESTPVLLAELDHAVPSEYHATIQRIGLLDESKFYL
ncbi:hypothetical protein PR048_012311 [Dryococelus australis]|uniref:Uncharacterized protein n=1 Tax=Dryococelus australis TaxID=614101 RepID=A0ABQ9HPD1_9NEOP|nr:hypothetical protein PR048_012311 [Dryococelus australis]